MNICVIIPSYNESKVIADLVERIKKSGLAVIVVDDGSQDNTATLAAQMGATVLRNEEKQGKGASLRKGFAFALQQPCAAVITMDGDGQHDPADLPKFLAASHQKEPCLIVGNRLADSRGMPFLRWLTNRFMSSLISLICRQQIPDSQCGFRFISCEILRRIELKTDNFEIESEMLVAASRQGFKIFSVAIRTIYRDEKSNINPWVDTLRFFKFLFRRK